MFCCGYCHRNYQRKLYFDRHVIVCQYLVKPKRDRELESEELADTPSVRDLYTIIMTLAAKCDVLETKLSSIQKWANITKQKLNITEWLNTTYTGVLDYDVWFAGLTVSKVELAVLFETDYVEGVVRLLKKQLPSTDEQRPLRAFTGKENTFYICRAKRWVVCDNETFTKLMYLLDKEFMREFIEWQTDNQTRMATEDSFSELYAKNMKKIMGSNYTREQLYSRIKKEWYQYLRREPPSIMEYEMTF
jgi:hypothetical protein